MGKKIKIKSRLPSFLKRKCNLVQCAFIFLFCSFSFLLISCASAYICILKVSRLFVKKYQKKLHLVHLVHVSGLLHKRNRLPWGIVSRIIHNKGEEILAQALQA